MVSGIVSGAFNFSNKFDEGVVSYETDILCHDPSSGLDVFDDNVFIQNRPLYHTLYSCGGH